MSDEPRLIGIEEQIVNRLLAHQDVSSLVGEHIYPRRAPADIAEGQPFIIYRTLAGEGRPVSGQTSDFKISFIAVTVVAPPDGYATMKAIENAVYLALDGWSDRDNNVQGVTYERHRETEDLPVDGSDRPKERVIIDFRVQHRVVLT